MQDSSSQGFGKLRSFFWPVYQHENKKVIPILLIGFLISFNYSILRIVKDTLVVTARESGAETIPFIKVWVLLPMAVFMTYLFTKLSNRFRREQVFYAMTSLFLVYFSIFVYFIYPIRESLHPHESADFLQSLLPYGCKGFVAVFRNWSLTSYYVMAELWGTIILSLLFWGFANQVTSLQEAGRFYALIGISLNFAGIFAGQLSVVFSRHQFNPNLPFGTDAWEQSLIFLISTVNICGLLIMYLFRKVHKTIVKEEKKSENPNTKIKMSIQETLSYLSKSRYLLSIALIVFSYNLVINLVEVVWKGELKQLFPNPSDYNAHMSQVSTAMGIIATFISFFISGPSIRRYGWTMTASITPFILFVASLGFFGFLLLKTYALEATLDFLQTSPLLIVCLFGSAHNAFCRGAKYSLFDSTKEMAFIPLSLECKLKGKAGIDGICSRLGKSGGSFIHQSLLLLFGTLSNSAPYVAVIVFAAIALWLYCIRQLGQQVQLFIRKEDFSTTSNVKKPLSEKL